MLKNNAKKSFDDEKILLIKDKLKGLFKDSSILSEEYIYEILELCNVTQDEDPVQEIVNNLENNFLEISGLDKYIKYKEAEIYVSLKIGNVGEKLPFLLKLKRQEYEKSEEYKNFDKNFADFFARLKDKIAEINKAQLAYSVIQKAFQGFCCDLGEFSDEIIAERFLAITGYKLLSKDGLIIGMSYQENSNISVAESNKRIEEIIAIEKSGLETELWFRYHFYDLLEKDQINSPEHKNPDLLNDMGDIFGNENEAEGLKGNAKIRSILVDDFIKFRSRYHATKIGETYYNFLEIDREKFDKVIAVIKAFTHEFYGISGKNLNQLALCFFEEYLGCTVENDDVFADQSKNIHISYQDNNYFIKARINELAEKSDFDKKFYKSYAKYHHQLITRPTIKESDEKKVKCYEALDRSKWGDFRSKLFDDDSVLNKPFIKTNLANKLLNEIRVFYINLLEISKATGLELKPEILAEICSTLFKVNLTYKDQQVFLEMSDTIKDLLLKQYREKLSYVAEMNADISVRKTEIYGFLQALKQSYETPNLSIKDEIVKFKKYEVLSLELFSRLGMGDIYSKLSEYEREEVNARADKFVAENPDVVEKTKPKPKQGTSKGNASTRSRFYRSEVGSPRNKQNSLEVNTHPNFETDQSDLGKFSPEELDEINNVELELQSFFTSEHVTSWLESRYISYDARSHSFVPRDINLANLKYLERLLFENFPYCEFEINLDKKRYTELKIIVVKANLSQELISESKDKFLAFIDGRKFKAEPENFKNIESKDAITQLREQGKRKPKKSQHNNKLLLTQEFRDFIFSLKEELQIFYDDNKKFCYGNIANIDILHRVLHVYFKEEFKCKFRNNSLTIIPKKPDLDYPTVLEKIKERYIALTNMQNIQISSDQVQVVPNQFALFNLASIQQYVNYCNFLYFSYQQQLQASYMMINFLQYNLYMQSNTESSGFTEPRESNEMITKNKKTFANFLYYSLDLTLNKRDDLAKKEFFDFAEEEIFIIGQKIYYQLLQSLKSFCHENEQSLKPTLDKFRELVVVGIYDKFFGDITYKSAEQFAEKNNEVVIALNCLHLAEVNVFASLDKRDQLPNKLLEIFERIKEDRSLEITSEDEIAI